jgi:hypothetical protein
MLANLMFQRGDIEQALLHFKQLFAKKPGMLTGSVKRIPANI